MKYEMMTIYKNELGEEGAKALSGKVSEILSSMGAKDVKNDFWGRRKFAYEINHNTEGFYDVFTFEIDSSVIKNLKEKLNLINGLVRYLVTAQK
ncbi:MAG TPA: 30S ribosomal protein S6 [bacterium]|jgi:small subunit ribosomal protein S6|nr:30S ribosomal protein S6 [bacterium]